MQVDTGEVRDCEMIVTRPNSVAPKIVRGALEGKVTSDNHFQRLIDEPMTSDEMTPFLPHSSESIYGLDNHEQYMEHLLQSNFHARFIQKMQSEAVYYPSINVYLHGYVKHRMN